MITTFQQHTLQQQREVPYASGDFSWLLVRNYSGRQDD